MCTFEKFSSYVDFEDFSSYVYFWRLFQLSVLLKIFLVMCTFEDFSSYVYF